MASEGPEVSPDSTGDQRRVGREVTTGPETTEDRTERQRPGEDGVCSFFRMGKCHFGDRCRLSHSLSEDQPGAAPLDQDDKEDEGVKHKKKTKKGPRSKAMKPKDDEEPDVNKKPRMRTADDVISRILWDQSADADRFIVGYVDRFLGVMERPFNDFNWDLDPSECDYGVELALPRHRIQYFSYGGRCVWDRGSRTDRVFGSTGQSLAPPFGREEEADEAQPECVGAEGAEAEEQQQRDPDGREAPPPGGNSQGTRSVDSPQAFTDRAEAETGPQKEEEGPGNAATESVGDGENVLSDMAALHLSQEPSLPPQQADEAQGDGRRGKRPTHFIMFRANTPTVLRAFQQLREEVTAILPSSAPHWQLPSTLHVTLCLLNLPGPAELADAVEILRRFARWNKNPPLAVTFPVKLKTFDGKVLYLSPQPQLQLQQLNGGLQEAFRAKGWLHKHSYNPRYHLTLAKVEDREGERIFDKPWGLKPGWGLNFGRLPVNTLHLCSVGTELVDGFYDTTCSVNLH